MDELWWQKERREQRKRLDRLVRLREEVRGICGQQGNLVDDKPKFPKPARPKFRPHQYLPDGLERGKDGLWAICRSCGQPYHYDGDIEEFTQESSYCGGSPRCLP